MLRINGPGNQLPPPQSLFPQIAQGGVLAYNAQISNQLGVTPGTNWASLPAGQTALIPAGDFIYVTDGYTLVQILDPVSDTWVPYTTSALNSGYIRSDGINFRFANLTGCPLGAAITAAGSGYTSAPTVTASAGGSLWTAIIGGAVNTTVTITTAGSGYTLPPIIEFSAPSVGLGNPGITAAGYCTLTTGAVSGVTITNQGAGYTSVPTITVIPNPADPNLASITSAVLTPALTGSGTVTGVVCTFNGAPVANQAATPTLTFTGGGGSSAAATVNMLWTATAAVTGGTGYPTVVGITTTGGQSTAGSVYTNPFFEGSIGIVNRPYRAQVAGSAGALSSITAVQDQGLFVVGGTTAGNAPQGLALGGAPTAAGTVTMTLASVASRFFLQPL